MTSLSSTARAGLCVTLLVFSLAATAQTTHNVTVGDNFFSPSQLTIQAGDTVRWNNAAGGNPHDVTADNGSFASQTTSSFTFTRTFNNAGQVPYHCTVHGAAGGIGMSGTITVEGGGGNPADLAMSEVSVNSDPVYAPGDPLAIGAEVDNLGGSASAAYTVNFYASTNASITFGDILLGNANRPALGAGNSDNFNANVNLPQNLGDGNYFIGAIIDVNDANNGNNSNLDDEPIEVTASGGAEFVINNGLNDSWWNPATGGQGLFITVFPEINAIFLAWFTYDTERPAEGIQAFLGEPGHRWLTAFGNYAGNIANLAVELTQGGVFDASDPPVEQDPDYGTIELEFLDCNNAILRYNIPSLGLMGEIEITRIALDNVPRCQAAQPQ